MGIYFSQMGIFSQNLFSQIIFSQIIFSQMGIYSAKRKYIQSNRNLFSQPDGNLFSQMGIYILPNGWRPKPGAIWPNQVAAMVPILRHPFFQSWVGWGAACTSMIPTVMHRDSQVYTNKSDKPGTADGIEYSIDLRASKLEEYSKQYIFLF